MPDSIKSIIESLELEGYDVMNWKPGNRRIFKVLKDGREVSGGMYSNELRAWFWGHLQRLRTG